MNEPIRENGGETQLSLETILDFFKRNLIILLAALLVGVAGGYCISRFAIPRKYSSAVSIFTPNSGGTLSLTELNMKWFMTQTGRSPAPSMKQTTGRWSMTVLPGRTKRGTRRTAPT